MKWVASMSDKSTVYESISTAFTDLDQNSVEKFYLVEDNENFVPYDSASGILRFNTLDARKFGEVVDGQKFILEFDKELGVFKFTPSSFKALQSIQSEYEFSYKLGFDAYGNIDVNGQKLTLGIVLDSLYNFNSNRFTRLIQFKDGYSDVKLSNTEVVNKIYRTSAYTIGFESDYDIQGIKFNVKCVLEYNLITQSVNLKYTVISDTDVTVQLYLNYGGSERKIPVQLTKSSPMQTKKVLDLLK